MRVQNVDFTVRLRQKGTEFRSAKLSKMVYSKSRDAYQDLGASQLQVRSGSGGTAPLVPCHAVLPGWRR